MAQHSFRILGVALFAFGSASCGDELDVDLLLASSTTQATCPADVNEIMYRVTSGTTFFRDGVGFTPMRTKIVNWTPRKAMAAPLSNNIASLVITSPYPDCAGALADGIAARGRLEIDGSTAGVHLYRGGSGQTFYADINLSRDLLHSTTHTMRVVLPPTFRGGVTLSSSTVVEAEMMNPFTILNEAYSGPRCITCHNYIDASHPPYEGHPQLNPASFGDCQYCHRTLNNVYDVPADDEFNQWRAPPASFGIQWSTMTPQQRCAKTVERVQLTGDGVYGGITDHFHNDKRVRWAVEIGNAHDATYTPDSFCLGEPVSNLCPRQWPYSYDALDDLAADWALFALISPDPCSSIMAPSQYPITQFPSPI